jgi:hypothetical protein
VTIEELPAKRPDRHAGGSRGLDSVGNQETKVMADEEKDEVNLEAVGWVIAASAHWRKHRPRVMRELKAQGKMAETLQEVGEAAAEMYADLVDSGVDPRVAHEKVLYEMILLPDETPRKANSQRRSGTEGVGGIPL